VARSLQGLGDHSLMLGTTPSSFPAHDFGMRRHEAPDQLDIFVINSRNFILAKMARFWLWVDVHKNTFDL